LIRRVSFPRKACKMSALWNGRLGKQGPQPPAKSPSGLARSLR
jgi:hypothetical protein